MANKANPMAQMDNPLQGMPGPLEQMGRQMQQKAQYEIQNQINKQVQQANQQLNNAANQARQSVVGKQSSQASQPIQTEQLSGRVMSEESKAAKERLRSILAGRKGQVAGTEIASDGTSSVPQISITPGRKPSLNDQIPTKYKRMQKVKRSGDTPSKK